MKGDTLNFTPMFKPLSAREHDFILKLKKRHTRWFHIRMVLKSHAKNMSYGVRKIEDPQMEMRVKIMYLIMQLFFCLFISHAALGQEPFAGAVVKVIDGDSLQIKTNGEMIETRLYGIDSPEYNQRYSKAAKTFVRNQVQGKNVRVHPEYYDSYGRLVAIVRYGDKNLNQELVVSGYAWVYPKYCKKEICIRWKKDEKMAKDKQKGLWTEKKPVPPWKWKRMKRQ